MSPVLSSKGSNSVGKVEVAVSYGGRVTDVTQVSNQFGCASPPLQFLAAVTVPMC